MKNHSFLSSPSPLHRWGVFGHDSRLHGGSIFGARGEREGGTAADHQDAAAAIITPRREIAESGGETEREKESLGIGWVSFFPPTFPKRSKGRNG